MYCLCRYRIWAVVKFPQTNEVELVPHEWIKSGGKDGLICLWPSHLSASLQQKSIVLRTIPDVHKWTRHEAVVMCLTGNGGIIAIMKLLYEKLLCFSWEAFRFNKFPDLFLAFEF